MSQTCKFSHSAVFNLLIHFTFHSLKDLLLREAFSYATLKSWNDTPTFRALKEGVVDHSSEGIVAVEAGGTFLARTAPHLILVRARWTDLGRGRTLNTEVPQRTRVLVGVWHSLALGAVEACDNKGEGHLFTILYLQFAVLLCPVTKVRTNCGGVS